MQSDSNSVQESKELGVFYTDKLNIKMEGKFFEKYGDKFEIWLDNFGKNDTIDYGMFFENKKPILGEKFLHLEIKTSDDLSGYLAQYPNIFSSSDIFYGCCSKYKIYWFNETVVLKIYHNQEVVGTLKVSRW